MRAEPNTCQLPRQLFQVSKKPKVIMCHHGKWDHLQGWYFFREAENGFGRCRVEPSQEFIASIFSAFRLVSSRDQTCNAVSCIMRARPKTLIMGHVSAKAQLQRGSTALVRDDTNETPLPRTSLIPQDQAIMGFSFFAAKSVAEVSHSPASSPQSTSIGVSTALYQHSN